jgi:hypothetical protein
LATVLTGCGPSAKPVDLNTVFGNARVVAAMKNASTAKAFRLTSPKTGYEESLADYTSIAGPIDVPLDTATKLKSVLLDPDYVYKGAKSCVPDYGVRLEFIADNDRVDVLLCFECAILLVFHNGKLAGGADFDHADPQLAALVKPLFPDDPAIQALE